MTPKSNTKPVIEAAQLHLLERLCLACAVSGDEGEVRKIVLEQVHPIADQVRVDAMGNVLAVKAGQGEQRLKVMLAAHMDEIGFMLVSDEEDGYFRFERVGGIDLRQLPGKPVWIGQEHVNGVIGAKPIHLTTEEERTHSITLDSLRIDVGPGNNKVKVGDRATFATPFSRIGPSIRAKALDNRLGVATLIELLRHAPPNIDLFAAFTVQEEVGLRGAQVAAYAFNPDLAIVLDSTPANDLPSWDGLENTRYNTRLGAGPAIYIADSTTLSDPRLVRFLMKTAESAGIPYQIRQPGGGGTDAGAIHKQRSGIPSVSVSVPGRYAHTAASIARLADWKNTLSLVHTALCQVTAEILTPER
jgi:endoglucanase